MARPRKDRPKETIEDRNDFEELIKLWKAGKLKFLAVEEQAICYEEIIRLCKDGYSEQMMSPRGTVVSVVKRDLRTASIALKEYREMISEAQSATEGNGKVSLVINVKEAKPD